MNRTKLAILLAVGALVCGGAAAYLVNLYIERQVAQEQQRLRARYEPVPVLVARRDLSPGDALNSNTVARREVPRAFVSDDAIRPSQYQDVAGRALAVAVSAGDSILTTQLAQRAGRAVGQLIGDNQRAITLNVDDTSSIGGMLRPSDRVDILATLDRGDGTEVSLPVAEKMRVVATGGQTRLQRAAGGRGNGVDFNTITMAADPQEAATILHAKRLGDLEIQLRSEADDRNFPELRVTRDTLLGGIAGPQRQIEKIIGGRQ